MNAPIEFSLREQTIVSLLRDEYSTRPSRVWFNALCYLAPSLALAIYCVVQEELVLGFIGYGLLFLRECYQTNSAAGSGKVYRSIFAKYDATLKELSEELARRPAAPPPP
jgi:hypothetical protein